MAKRTTKKRSKSEKADAESSNGEDVKVDNELLGYVKECESQVESSRLDFEEAKAKHGLAKAEYKLLVARRNRMIARTDDPTDVEDAQRQVHNAKIRVAKAKAIQDAAKDEFKGADEKLGKAFTDGKLPLFDGK